MLQGIDHLVIAVENLEVAVESYRALGFSVVPGGRHPGIGTYNALVAFRDGSYLELIGFYEPRPDHRWWTPLERGGGLVDFSMRTDDLAADTRALQATGVAFGDPESRSRRRPDGYEVRWIFSLAGEAYRGVLPFIIQDETPREERVPRETTHPNGVTGIGAVTVAVQDTAVVAALYERAVRRPGETIARPELEAAGARFVFGPHAIDLVAPLHPTSPVAKWVDSRGPGPYAATLRTSSGTPGPLDLASTHGARLTFVPAGEP